MPVEILPTTDPANFKIRNSGCEGWDNLGVHAICRKCAEASTKGYYGHQTEDPKTEICCFCGDFTTAGIYIPMITKTGAGCICDHE